MLHKVQVQVAVEAIDETKGAGATVSQMSSVITVFSTESRRAALESAMAKADDFCDKVAECVEPEPFPNIDGPQIAIPAGPRRNH